MKKVSAIIPTIGRISYLDKAISSLLNQKNKFDEILIFDNSIEQNLQNISLFGNNQNIKFIKSGKQLNPIKSWNTAIEKTNCEYVTIIGDDDIVDINYKNEIDLILERSDFGILKAKAINEHDLFLMNLQYPLEIKEMTSEEFRHYRFNGKLSLYVPGVVFKKEHFLTAGGFKNTQLNGLAYSDEMLFYKIAHLSKNVVISNNICWSYRIHSEQIGNLKNIEKYIDKIYYYVEFFENEMKEFGLNKKDLYQSFSNKKYIERILNSELSKFMTYSIDKKLYLFMVVSLIKYFFFNNRISIKFKFKFLYRFFKIIGKSIVK